MTTATGRPIQSTSSRTHHARKPDLYASLLFNTRRQAEAIVWTREAEHPSTTGERLAEMAECVGISMDNGRRDVLSAIVKHPNAPWRLLAYWGAFRWTRTETGGEHPWGSWLAPDALAELERRSRSGLLADEAIREVVRHPVAEMRAFGRHLALIRGTKP